MNYIRQRLFALFVWPGAAPIRPGHERHSILDLGVSRSLLWHCVEIGGYRGLQLRFAGMLSVALSPKTGI